MSTALYVSPHLDDVALSCAGGLVTRAAAGHRVVVATVFTAGAPARAYARRRAEDRAALRAHGIEHLHLGLTDAPTRLGVAPSFRSLLLGPPPRRALVNELAQALAVLHARLDPDETWLPLAIGGHVDHRATFAAGLRLRAPLRFYEDRPYAFSPLLRRLRAMELAGAPPLPRSAAQVATDLATHGCGALLEVAERDPVAARLAARLGRNPRAPRWRVRTVLQRYRAATARSAMGLIESYVTETRWLFGDAPLLPLWTRLAPAGPNAFWERDARLLPPS